MINVSPRKIIKKSHLEKLMIINEYFDDKDIFLRLINLIDVIHRERHIFKYVYKNINYIQTDNYLSRIITELNFDLIVIRCLNKIKLEYDNTIIDKFIYIISMLMKFNSQKEILTKVTNTYLSKIIHNGNKYFVINACLLSFYIKMSYYDIVINYDYYQGLIECLYLSSRWNDYILYFHNKQFLYKFDLNQVYIEVMKYLFHKKDDYSYNTMMNLLGEKSDCIIIEDVSKILKNTR